MDEADFLTISWREATVSAGSLRPALRGLSDRVTSAQDVQREIPAAYARALARLGLDQRTPFEAYVVERLIHGAYRSRGVLKDALLIATVETGVGVWACDGVGPLRLEGTDVVGPGGVIAPVFTTPDVTGPSVVLYALIVPGVPSMAVDEALWTAADALAWG